MLKVFSLGFMKMPPVKSAIAVQNNSYHNDKYYPEP